MKLLSTQKLELATSTADAIHVVAGWADIDKTAATTYTPGTTDTTLSSATTKTIVAAPSTSSIYREVTDISIRNDGAGANTVRVQRDTGGTDVVIESVSLAAGESLRFESRTGWDRYTALGERMVSGRDGADGATGAAGVGTSGTTTIDFGSFPGAPMASVAVTGQATIASDSKTEAWILPAATSDHSADEHLVEPIRVIAGPATAGVGFTIYAFGDSPAPPPGPDTTIPRRNHGGAGRQRPSGVNRYRNPTPHGTFTVAWRWS